MAVKRSWTNMPEQAAQMTSGIDVARRLDLERTHIAYEQSMMSWIRTATALITFGFTIYKFFQLELPGRSERTRLLGPREFALSLVSLGLISLALATLQHRRSMRVLKDQWPDAPRSLAVLLAAMISILGIVAFLIMIFRQ
jgi:putative membrane protein